MPNIMPKYCPSEAKLVFANNIQPITTAMSVNACPITLCLFKNPPIKYFSMKAARHSKDPKAKS